MRMGSALAAADAKGWDAHSALTHAFAYSRRWRDGRLTRRGAETAAAAEEEEEEEEEEGAARGMLGPGRERGSDGTCRGVMGFAEGAAADAVDFPPNDGRPRTSLTTEVAEE